MSGSWDIFAVRKYPAQLELIWKKCRAIKKMSNMNNGTTGKYVQ